LPLIPNLQKSKLAIMKTTVGETRIVPYLKPSKAWLKSQFNFGINIVNWAISTDISRYYRVSSIFGTSKPDMILPISGYLKPRFEVINVFI